MFTNDNTGQHMDNKYTIYLVTYASALTINIIVIINNYIIKWTPCYTCKCFPICYHMTVFTKW